MKQKKSPHLKPLLPHKAGQAQGEEVNESLLTSSKTILQKLSALEELLKKRDEKPLNFKEACAYLGYAPSYLYKLTYQKIIPHYKPTGKMIFFSKNEVDRWIFGSRCKAQGARNDDGGSTTSSTSSEFQLTARDPNQVDLFENDFDGKKKRRNEEINGTEILIEFPLKSRRGK